MSSPHNKISPEKLAQLWAAFDRLGNKWAAAREVGIGKTAATKYLSRRRPTSEMPTPVPSSAVEEMRKAAERVKAADEDEDEPAEVVWKREEERAARACKRAIDRSTFRWRAPGKHLLLAFVSDQHISPGTPTDFRRMREDAELIASTPDCYAILGGDTIDNHLKHRAAVIAARSQPEDQWKLLEYYLSLLGDRCLLLTSGNHEAWTNQFAGVDVLGRIARDRRVAYAPHEGRLEITVGNQTYHVAVRHQYRFNSAFNQTHTVKQWVRMGEAEFDIGCIGHHHEHAMESFVYRGRLRWGCRPGSYQITSAYARQYGFNAALPTTPAFLLRGDEHEISGFPTLRQALAVFRAGARFTEGF